MNFLSSQTLNNEFDNIKQLVEKFNKEDNINNFLPKIGLFSHLIEKNNAMNQGTYVEACLADMTNAIRLDNDGKNVTGEYGNCDLVIRDFKLSVKSSIKKSGVLKIKTDGVQGRSKIFDTSRKTTVKNCTDEYIIKEKLKEVCWEIPFLFYVFDIKLNKGILFLTSLSEIALSDTDGNKTEDETKELIYKLFSNNGAAHFFISIDAAYQIALKNERVIKFDITKEDREKYVERKLKEVRPSKAQMTA